MHICTNNERRWFLTNIRKGFPEGFLWGASSSAWQVEVELMKEVDLSLL